MNYKLHYDALIIRAKSRVLSGYIERHHIIPRCLGGIDKTENIVCLTPEEHYVAHQLLVKLHPQHKWLALAATRMSKQCTGRRAYGWLRRRNAIAMSIAKTGLKKPPVSEETKAKLSAANKGRPLSKEHREKLSLAKIGKKRKPFSQETRDKLSKLMKLRRLAWREEGRRYGA